MIHVLRNIHLFQSSFLIYRYFTTILNSTLIQKYKYNDNCDNKYKNMTYLGTVNCLVNSYYKC